MQNNPPCPFTQLALGILDIVPTLVVTPSNSPQLASFNLPPLSFLLLADRLGALYEMVFPDHPEWLTEEAVNWESEEDVTAAVERFLQRVNTLFPVHDDVLDVDLEAAEWRLYEIPIIPMGYDEWYDGWDDLKEPAPYLLHLRYSRSQEERSPFCDDFTDLYLYPDHQLPKYFEAHRLVLEFRQNSSNEMKKSGL